MRERVKLNTEARKKVNWNCKRVKTESCEPEKKILPRALKSDTLVHTAVGSKSLHA